MEELTQILKTATAALESGYFRLTIDGGDPVYRERVYCYELYHQMRKIWPPNTEFYLNGEVDKASNPSLQELGADWAKPDLLVHRPGYMIGNHAIIEVKKSSARSNEIEKDLEKISLFINKVGYKRAIYLFYGNEINDEELINKVRKRAEEIKDLAEIEIWCHQEVGKPATCICQIP